MAPGPKTPIPNRPGVSNWVEDAGGLPSYIRRIAEHLHGKGHSTSSAIAMAVGTVKRWASGTNHNGGKLNPDTVAKAQAAVAQWEKMKGKSKAKAIREARKVRDLKPTPDELREVAAALEGRSAIVEGLVLATQGDDVRAGTVAAAFDLLEGRGVTLRIDPAPADPARARRAHASLVAERTLAGELVEALTLDEAKRGERAQVAIDATKAPPAAKEPKPKKGDEPKTNPLPHDPDSGRTGHLQNRLNALGHSLASDGDFGPETDRAVREFQRSQGLEEDGVVGPKTTERLREPSPPQTAEDREAAKEKAGKGSQGAENGSGKASAAKDRDKDGDKGAGEGEGEEASEASSAKAKAKGAGGRVLFKGVGVGEKAGDGEVKGLQDDLAYMGYHVEKDGRFGPETEGAVKKMQRRQGLKADGIVGDKTRLTVSDAKKAKTKGDERVEESRTEHWDPTEHPRGRGGVFIEKLEQLRTGHVLALPNGVRVRKTLGGHFAVNAHGVRATHSSPQEAADHAEGLVLHRRKKVKGSTPWATSRLVALQAANDQFALAGFELEEGDMPRNKKLDEAARRGASRVRKLMRLPDGTFAPKGRGAELDAGDTRRAAGFLPKGTVAHGRGGGLTYAKDTLGSSFDTVGGMFLSGAGDVADRSDTFELPSGTKITKHGLGELRHLDPQDIPDDLLNTAHREAATDAQGANFFGDNPKGAESASRRAHAIFAERQKRGIGEDTEFDFGPHEFDPDDLIDRAYDEVGDDASREKMGAAADRLEAEAAKRASDAWHNRHTSPGGAAPKRPKPTRKAPAVGPAPTYDPSTDTSSETSRGATSRSSDAASLGPIGDVKRDDAPFASEQERRRRRNLAGQVSAASPMYLKGLDRVRLAKYTKPIGTATTLHHGGDTDFLGGEVGDTVTLTKPASFTGNARIAPHFGKHTFFHFETPANARTFRPSEINGLFRGEDEHVLLKNTKVKITRREKRGGATHVYGTVVSGGGSRLTEAQIEASLRWWILEEVSVRDATRGAAQELGESALALRGKQSARELRESALVSRGKQAARSIKRLPDGQFAPRGRGQVLRPGQEVKVPHKNGGSPVRGIVKDGGSSVQLLDGPDQGKAVKVGAWQPGGSAKGGWESGSASPFDEKGNAKVGDLPKGTRFFSGWEGGHRVVKGKTEDGKVIAGPRDDSTGGVAKNEDTTFPADTTVGKAKPKQKQKPPSTGKDFNPQPPEREWKEFQGRKVRAAKDMPPEAQAKFDEIRKGQKGYAYALEDEDGNFFAVPAGQEHDPAKHELIPLPGGSSAKGAPTLPESPKSPGDRKVRAAKDKAKPASGTTPQSNPPSGFPAGSQGEEISLQRREGDKDKILRYMESEGSRGTAAWSLWRDLGVFDARAALADLEAERRIRRSTTGGYDLLPPTLPESPKSPGATSGDEPPKKLKTAWAAFDKKMADFKAAKDGGNDKAEVGKLASQVRAAKWSIKRAGGDPNERPEWASEAPKPAQDTPTLKTAAEIKAKVAKAGVESYDPKAGPSKEQKAENAKEMKGSKPKPVTSPSFAQKDEQTKKEGIAADLAGKLDAVELPEGGDPEVAELYKAAVEDAMYAKHGGFGSKGLGQQGWTKNIKKAQKLAEDKGQKPTEYTDYLKALLDAGEVHHGGEAKFGKADDSLGDAGKAAADPEAAGKAGKAAGAPKSKLASAMSKEPPGGFTDADKVPSKDEMAAKSAGDAEKWVADAGHSIGDKVTIHGAKGQKLGDGIVKGASAPGLLSVEQTSGKGKGKTKGLNANLVKPAPKTADDELEGNLKASIAQSEGKPTPKPPKPDDAEEPKANFGKNDSPASTDSPKAPAEQEDPGLASDAKANADAEQFKKEIAASAALEAYKAAGGNDPAIIAALSGQATSAPAAPAAPAEAPAPAAPAAPTPPPAAAPTPPAGADPSGLAPNTGMVDIEHMTPGQVFEMNDGSQWQYHKPTPGGKFHIVKPVGGGKAKPFHSKMQPPKVGPATGTPPPDTGAVVPDVPPAPADGDLFSKLSDSVAAAKGAPQGQGYTPGEPGTNPEMANPSLHNSPGRGPTGKMRNFKAMSISKLKGVIQDLMAHGGDPEALQAAQSALALK